MYYIMTIKKNEITTDDPDFYGGCSGDINKYIEKYSTFTDAVKNEEDEYALFFDKNGSQKVIDKKRKSKGTILSLLTVQVFEDRIIELLNRKDERKEFITRLKDKNALLNGIYKKDDDNEIEKCKKALFQRGGVAYESNNQYVYIPAWGTFGGVRFAYECLNRWGDEEDCFKIYYKKENIVTKTGEQEKTVKHESKNIILYGPPGTGKTREAKERAIKIVHEKNKKIENIEDGIKAGYVKMVQFHPSYTYEDFVRGISVETSKNGKLRFPVKPKAFELMCNAAMKDKKHNFVIIIDEINRAPLSSVFGELLYGIEYRDKVISTPYPLLEKGKGGIKEEKQLCVPNNLFIIGTMNTADKSIGSMDYAIRRRFDFVPIYAHPLGENTEGVVKNEKAPQKNLYFLKATFETVRKNVLQSVARGVDANDIMPGESYFLLNYKDNGPDWDHFEYKMKYELIPLLQEYAKDGLFTKRKVLDDPDLSDSEKKNLIDLISSDDAYYSYLFKKEKKFNRKLYNLIREALKLDDKEDSNINIIDYLNLDIECFLVNNDNGVIDENTFIHNMSSLINELKNIDNKEIFGNLITLKESESKRKLSTILNNDELVKEYLGILLQELK